MAEKTGGRIKVTLRWIQILDKMEPAWKEKGEFRFTARVSGENGVLREMKFPEQGHYDISDHPAWNKVVLNRTIYEGDIGDHLVIELNGEELDTMSKNDMLDSYRREFRGDARKWAGWYGPGDDVPPDAVNTADPENMSNWRVCYVIEAL